MPLSKGKSEKAFKENVKTEYEAGKPLKQSLAIAYNMKRKAQKKADGGFIKDNYQSHCTEHCESPCAIHEQASGFVEHEGDHKRPDEAAIHEDERTLNQHGEYEVGPGGMAYGGETMVHEADEPEGRNRGMSKAGEHVILGENDKAKEEHYRILGQMKADKRDRKYMAEGGFIDGGYDDEQGDPKDVVKRVMKQRAQQYSKGGQVANQDHGENDNELAGFSPNEFDDLVLRDDDMEDADYTGANSGDELSSPGEDERRRDIVSKVMASRKKKDKLPNPR